LFDDSCTFHDEEKFNEDEDDEDDDNEEEETRNKGLKTV